MKNTSKLQRTVSFSLSQANPGKTASIGSVFFEARRVIQIYLDYYWGHQEYSQKYTTFKVDSWLSAAMLQVLGKQALDIMRSLKKKHKKSKPELKNLVLTLDRRFFPDLRPDKGHFDFWFSLSGLGKNGHRISLRLPLKSHRLVKKYRDWTLSKSFRLGALDGDYFLDLIYEKEPEPQVEGRVLGIDMGYKNLVTTSDGDLLGTHLEGIYDKISKKVRGSKRFKRVQRHRNCEINRTLNQMDLSGVGVIAIEGLKDVKRYSKQKKKMATKVMNRLQWWSYPRTVKKLRDLSEVRGIRLVEVPPAYTSQTCPACGARHRENRHGEVFRCLGCGYENHADVVGAINVLRRGEVLVHSHDCYLPSFRKKEPSLK